MNSTPELKLLLLLLTRLLQDLTGPLLVMMSKRLLRQQEIMRKLLDKNFKPSMRDLLKEVKITLTQKVLEMTHKLLLIIIYHQSRAPLKVCKNTLLMVVQSLMTHTLLCKMIELLLKTSLMA